MKIFNSLTGKREEFKPIEEGVVRMYTCGPTVYHFAHIGNLRTYIMEDILEKFLSYEGYDVKRVMNITDVGHLSSDADTGEDKMLKGAKREKKSVMEIAQYYTDAFFDDCKKLGIKKPEICVPATSCVPEYIHLIETLIEKGYAYIAGGNIYFDTAKLDKYYAFGNFSEEDLAIAVRDDVEQDDNKKSKADFVLWFTKSKFDDQELKWDSPWGVGYPGWHIECSAISMKYLGEYLDIHCGGVDNAFPHHTNEIAQSEAYVGHKWCNYWFHVLHLNDARGKMSKSKGDFLTVSLLEDKKYNPLAYRFFCLQSHYKRPLAFSFESLDNATQAYEKLLTRISNLKAEGEVDESAKATWKQKFIDAVGNDLASSMGITLIYDVLKSDANSSTKLAIIDDYDKVLSLDLVNSAKKMAEEKSHDLSAEEVAEIENLIAQRTKARAEKDWATADKIRDELNARKIIVKDTADGITWTKA
ncbi:MAG: cysteine--tRNA ligase [Clostridia bacterium]